MLKGARGTVRIMISAEFAADLDNDAVTVQFPVIYRKPKAQEAADVLAKARKNEITDSEIAHMYVQGWDQVTRADGTPVAFSAEALDELLDTIEYRRAIAGGFVEVATGMNGSAAKN